MHLNIMSKQGISSEAACKAATAEERTRYDALFFSQEPIDGLLAGEKARELFLRSKLPLPVLSKIWHLVDIPHDNMLDHAEFGNAVHLLRHSMRTAARQATTHARHEAMSPRSQRIPLPSELPPGLAVPRQERVVVPHMNGREYAAYRKLFENIKRDWNGFVEAHIARDVFLSSGLPRSTLAHAWNLSDVDRDGKLSLEEFTIACHLIRYCKRGRDLDGPVNVQALLPNKLPKSDLAPKKKKLRYLEKRKYFLMALREKRREEATREARRVELWRERLKILQAMHQALRDDDAVDVTISKHDVTHRDAQANGVQRRNAHTMEAERRDALQEGERRLRDMETVAHRLKKEDDKVRQQTAKVIIEEQKLSRDVTQLENEAEQMRQRSKRNSILKDIDPFHQLYEQRKEEKLTGVSSPGPKYELNIPPHLDPFDPERLDITPLSGEQLFACQTPIIGCSMGDLPHNPWSPGDLDKASVDSTVAALTHGFEDNFVEKWAESIEHDRQMDLTNPGLADIDKDFDFEDDAVFKTVPVTEEEDDLWSSLPEDVLANQRAQFDALHSQLKKVKEKIHELNESHDQIVFKHPEEYAHWEQKQEFQNTDVISVKRHSSDSLLRPRHATETENETGRPNSYHGYENKHASKQLENTHCSDVKTTKFPLQGVREESETLRLSLDFLKETEEDLDSRTKLISGKQLNDNANWSTTETDALKSKTPKPPHSENAFEDNINPQFLSANSNTSHDVCAETCVLTEDKEQSGKSPGDSKRSVKFPPESEKVSHEESRDTCVADNSFIGNAESCNNTALDIPTSAIATGAHVQNINTLITSQPRVPSKPVPDSFTKELTIETEFPLQFLPAKSQSASNDLLELDLAFKEQPSAVTENAALCVANKPVELRKHVIDKSERAQKSKTWHSSGPAPVPPPRKKSPRKSSSKTDQTNSHSSTGEDSHLWRTRSEKTISKSEFSSCDSSSQSTPVTSPSPTRPLRKQSPKKRHAPAPPGRSQSLFELHTAALGPTAASPNVLDLKSPQGRALSPSLSLSSSSTPVVSPGSPERSLLGDTSPPPVAPPRAKRASKRQKQLSNVSLSSDSAVTSSDAQSVTSEAPQVITSETHAGSKGTLGKAQDASVIFASQSQAITSYAPDSDNGAEETATQVNLSVHSTVLEDAGSFSARIQTETVNEEDAQDGSLSVDKTLETDIKARNRDPSPGIGSGVVVKDRETDRDTDPNDSYRDVVPAERAVDSDTQELPHDTRFVDKSEFSNTNENDFKQEIEAVFAQVAVDENIVLTFEEDKLADDTEESRNFQNKATSSDYFSQSDGSIIDDDMESVARKQELDKLRGLYFGELKSPQTSPRSQDNTGSAHPYDEHSVPMHEGTLIMLSDDSEQVHNDSKQVSVTNVNIGPDTKDLVLSNIEDSSYTKDIFSEHSKGSFDKESILSGRSVIEETLSGYAHQERANAHHNEPLNTNVLDTETNSHLDQNFNQKDTNIGPLVVDSKQNRAENKDRENKYKHVLVKEKILIGVQSNYIDAQKPPKPKMSDFSDPSRDSDDSDADFEATFDPRNTNVKEEPASPRDHSDVTLISYQQAPTSPGVQLNIQLRDSRSSAADKEGSPGSKDMKWFFESSKVEDAPPLPSEPPPPLPSNPPPPVVTVAPVFTNITSDLETDTLNDGYKNVQGIYGKDHSNALKSPLYGKSPNYLQNVEGSSVSTSLSAQALTENSTQSTFNGDVKPGEKQGTYGYGSGYQSGAINVLDLVADADKDSLSKSGAVSVRDPDGSDTHKQGGSMDPVTGLRRTQMSTPVEKAIKFVQETEPTFRVKKVPSFEDDDGAHLTGFKTRAQEIEEERLEILDEMKIRKKTLTHWLSDEERQTEGCDKSESERLYEERKKKLQYDNGTKKDDARESAVRNYPAADIDSRSLNEQKHATIQHWEQKFSEPDTQLFPRLPATPQTVSKSNVSVVHTPIIKATDYSDFSKAGLKDHESAIEREIRLAQEREAELKRERARIAQGCDSERELKVDTDSKQTEHTNKTAMPIHKLPALTSPTSPVSSTALTSPKATVAKQHSPQTYQEMTEADRDAMKHESIIEREIREQLAREEELRRQARAKQALAQSKEAEQSEAERREKEQEKVNAHESIIEREIREQREREREIQGMRAPGQPAVQTVVISTQTSENVVHPKQSSPPRLPATAPPKGNMQNSDESYSERDVHSDNVYDPKTGRIDQTITYVDAIASCAHAGESLIARELREQREREEELRSQWKSSGLDVPLSSQEPPDTPYNMPEPQQPPTLRQYKESANHVTTARRVSADSQSSAEHTHGEGRDATSQPKQIKPKVQPYVEYDDEEGESEFRFVPQTETPVEKEIRIARERENALRAEKGLPASTREDETYEVLIDVTSPPRGLNHPRRVSDSDSGAMKRFASSRLQKEMNREKEREVELKQTGKIVTISEERVGELMNYKDIIPKEPVNPPVPKTPAYAQQKTSRASDSLSSSSKHSSMDDLDAVHQNGADVQDMPRQNTRKSPAVQKPAASTQHRPEPVNSMREPVNTRVEPVSYSRSHSSGHVVSKSGSMNAESLIERELREQKEREEELRRQRQMVLSGKRQTTVLPRGRDVIEDQPTIYRLVSSQSDDVTLREHNGGPSADAKGLRRKSALAEEWERKFGGAS